MRFIFSVITCFGCVLGGFAQDCSLRLAGHIEDADSRAMLPGAVVSILEIDSSLITDSKGDFVFTGLCPGTYTLQVVHVSCDTVHQAIVLSKNYHADIDMPHARRTLGIVMVESKKGIQNTGFKKELSGKILAQTTGFSLAESLTKMNGVTMLQTGSTISKPVIHGLHGNRILLINNGVRQEGQQWGNEHAPEVDPFIADKLTVIKGVDELQYGSDAIAGVILVQPKALRALPGYSGEINTAYFSNNRQYVLSGTWEQQLKKMPAFTYRLQGTIKKGANAATPDYRLNNTASEEANFSITAGYKKTTHFSTVLFYSHFYTKVGIFSGSHIGNITDLENAIAAPKPDDVFLGDDSYAIGRPSQEITHDLVKSKTVVKKGVQQFNIQLAAQYNHRKEFDVVRNSSNTNPQMDLRLYTFSEDINWEHPATRGFSGTIGIGATQQDNSYSGRYFIPNYNAYTFGAYVIEKWRRNAWELQGGIRFDNRSIHTRRLKFNGDTLDHNFNFSTLAASFNAIFQAGKNWKLNVNTSLASRAPYVNELLSDGIHHGTATYERGDVNLNPEKSMNVALGINYNNSPGNFSAELLLYINSIRDFIYRQPVPDSPVLTIAGAFPLFEYRQTNALLTGIDLSFMWQPVQPLQWNGKFSVLNARNRITDDWLILMPANRISNELSYNFKDGKRRKGSYISFEVQHVMEQTHVPDDSKGRQDYKPAPGAYTLVHVNAETIFFIGKKPLTIGVSVRNLLNTRYRDYLNSMRYFTDEMGRNTGIRLKIPFGQ